MFQQKLLLAQAALLAICHYNLVEAGDCHDVLGCSCTVKVTNDVGFGGVTVQSFDGEDAVRTSAYTEITLSSGQEK
eukprot:Awhi_evm1s1960